jgi:hypothetical protein
MNPPSLEEILLALAQGELPEDLSARIRASGEAGLTRLRTARRLEAASRFGPLPQVPKHLHDLALQARKHATPEPTARPLARALGSAREWLAEFLMDSAQGRPAAVLRGEGRHLLYRVGDFEIDLAWLDRGVLVGQDLPRGEQTSDLHGAMCVLCGETGVAQTPLESNGDFHFEGVGQDRYDLLVESEAVRLLVTDLELGGRG